MRLNRFLAAAGLGSRRSCEELILNGSVTINGQVCQSLARDVAEDDFVKVGGKRVVPEKPLYILLHKPRGYLCTASDTHDRRTIFDLLPGNWPRLFHVGRLDMDSEGLLILTNDGDLALRLTHPRYKIEKEYEVLLDHPYDAARDTPKLLKGVNTEHGRAKADLVRQLSPMLLRIVLRQGLKRQIRLMLYKVGYEVKRLIRTRIGGLQLRGLGAGEWRHLKESEIQALRTERQPDAAPFRKQDKQDAKPIPARRDAEGPRAQRGKETEPPRRGKASPRNGRRPGQTSRANGRSGSSASAPRAGRRRG